MTTEDTIKLAERVETWQKRLGPLGVAHWRIERVTVADEIPGSPSAQATVQPSHSYDSAHFWFRTEYVEGASARELDETIIHEWLHVAMRDLDESIDSINDTLSPAACEQWSDRVGHEREGFIDRLSRQIYAAYNTRRKEVVQSP